MEALWAALAAGDITAARAIATAPGEQGDLALLEAFLSAPPAGYESAARGAAGSVAFAGRLEHDEVAQVLPAAEAMVVPSTFPEAFGMVAAEAAATGALPVSANHSGLREVSGELAARLDPPAAELVGFDLSERAVEAIADRLRRWLELPAAERERARQTLTATARELWSWEGVAKSVISASAGELEALALVPPVSSDE
jgi:glycosyltransferase involved in cell wall biosynthesis